MHGMQGLICIATAYKIHTDRETHRESEKN